MLCAQDPWDSDSELRPGAFQGLREPCLPPRSCGPGVPLCCDDRSGSPLAQAQGQSRLMYSGPRATWATHTSLPSLSLLQVPPEVGVAPD